MKRGKPLKRTPMKPKPKRNPMPAGRHAEVMERDRWCQGQRHGVAHVCEGRLEVHHIVNRGAGGSGDPAIHDLDNLLLVCSWLNQWIENNPAEAKRLGLKRTVG